MLKVQLSKVVNWSIVFGQFLSVNLLINTFFEGLLLTPRKGKENQ